MYPLGFLKKAYIFPLFLFSRQTFRLIFGNEVIDQLVQLGPIHDAVDIIEGKVDTVVCDAPLGEVIGADALGAIAAAHLAFTIGG